MTTTTRYDISREQLTELLGGAPRYRVDQVWSGLYEQFTEPSEWTNLPKAMRAELTELMPSAMHLVTESVSTRGDTVKFLWELAGGSRVETVLMLYPDRATVCVSSQAGCAMGCGFCATGQAGFSRHVTTGEIVEQVVRSAHRARGSVGTGPTARRGGRGARRPGSAPTARPDRAPAAAGRPASLVPRSATRGSRRAAARRARARSRWTA